MESAGPGGARAHDFRGLDLALGVNGADGDLVGAGLGRGPIVVPDHPGKWGERQLERRVLPGPFAVETDLDLLDGLRSEEHTSELQSRLHLVCRLLLEKKKAESLSDSSSPHNHH